jgi:hypothetical protein
VPANHKKRLIAVIAMAEDGTTYRIERRSRSLTGDEGPDAFFYCCLPDGQPVEWLGKGIYRMPDGKIAKAVGAHSSRN